MRTALCLTITLLLASPAAAEPLIEEIIVRGEFRAADATDVSSSLTVLRLDAVADRVEHLEEVLGRAANVNFSSGASRARFYQVRGIGERGQFAEPLNASVGLLVDGVDLSGIGTVATLHDVEQVEVFRGPQGTLFGANALAGMINVTTNDPGDEWEATFDANIGDYDARGFGIRAGGPLSDRLGLRVSAYQHQDDGFIDNTFLGRDDTNDRDERTLRAKLVYTGEAVDWALTVGSIEADNGYDAFSLDNDRNTRSDQPGEDVQDTDYLSASMTWQLSEGRSLEAVLGYADSEISYGYDEDWTFNGFHPFGYSSTDFYLRDRETTTLDVRLLSAGDSDLTWVVGLYALQQDVSLRRVYTFQAADLTTEFDVDRVAGYGEVSYALSPGQRVKFGLRVERHSADYEDSVGVGFSPDDNMVGGRLVYEHDVLDDAMWFVSLNRGYKVGGFNTSGTLPPALREFDPETLWNLEGGLKGRFADGRLSLAATLFFMRRPDAQANTSRVIVRPDGSSEFIDYTDNALEGDNYGAELEWRYQASAALELFGSVGLLESEYDGFVNGAGDDVDGRDQAQAPGYQFYLGAEWSFAERWFARLELEGRDDYFFSDSHDTSSDSYELVHASLGYRSDRLDVTLWGRNLTDEDVFVRGFFFGNDPRDGYTARSFTQLGEPSRVGLTARYTLR